MLFWCQPSKFRREFIIRTNFMLVAQSPECHILYTLIYFPCFRTPARKQMSNGNTRLYYGMMIENEEIRLHVGRLVFLV